MSNIQILYKETLSERKYPLQYIAFEKPDQAGVFHNVAREVYFRPDAVAVLLIDEEREKILLVKQFRLPAFLNGSDSGYLIEACAGIVDDGETPEQTAYREVEEETGFQIHGLEKIASAYSCPGGTTEYVHLFTAKYTKDSKTGEGGGLAAEGESIELIELDFDEAKEKLKQGVFYDLKTILLLQHFFLSQS